MQNKSLLIALLSLCLLSYGSVWAQKSMSLEDIEKGWKTKTINHVANGSLGIMLERFDQTWPTWMGASVRDAMEKGLSKAVLDEETVLTVIVDSKNGYVEVSDAGTDGESMSACYWNRSNGHKLLAVCMSSPTDPYIEFVCFYDYDPQQKALIPEPDILAGFRPWTVEEPYSYNLPKQGKDLILEEWADEGIRRHIFAWNGMKPVFSKTEVKAYEDFTIRVRPKGAQPNVKDFLTAFLSQEDMGEAWAGIAQSWKLYQNGMKQIPGDTFTVDVQNGYIDYESVDDDGREVIQCCYWNYADKQHKLVAFTNEYFRGSLPVMTESTDLTFYKYDSATRKMDLVYAHDLGMDIELPPGGNGVSYALPRQGKTMTLYYYTASGKIPTRFTWNGSKFVKE